MRLKKVLNNNLHPSFDVSFPQSCAEFAENPQRFCEIIKSTHCYINYYAAILRSLRNSAGNYKRHYFSRRFHRKGADKYADSAQRSLSGSHFLKELLRKIIKRFRKAEKLSQLKLFLDFR